MKLKSIIACGIALLSLGAATTSCEDMFTADNKLVTTDLAPKDTVYQVMGIINRMQKLADRTVFLGELRGDLVNVDPAHSTTHLQELGNNRVSEDNIYNQPADYYDVINNCNIYLANVDSTYKVHGKKFYEAEIIGVKTFRAWCYLELAKIYGEVPFVTEPVLSPEAAEQIATSADKKDLVYITSWLIDDLKDYALRSENANLRPGWAAKPAEAHYSEFFIPVRVMLGELYLWRGSFTQNRQDYIDAIRMYHNYLTFPGECRTIAHGYNNYWRDESFMGGTMSYSNNFVTRNKADLDHVNDVYAGTMPLDTTQFNGTVSEIRSVFCSVPKNDYYPAATLSERLDSISMNQHYAKLVYNTATNTYKIPVPNYPSGTEKRAIGDVRLKDIVIESNKSDKYHSEYNRVRTVITKYTNGSTSLTNDERLNCIPYYRYSTVYLHLAEALNRAGYPETAFLILKWGITAETLYKYVSIYEKGPLCDIKAYGFYAPSEGLIVVDGEGNTISDGSFLVWPINRFQTANKLSANYSPSERSLSVQVGIHSYGSGDCEYDPYYVLPADSSRWVYVEEPEAPTYNHKEDPDSTIYKPLYAEYQADSLAYARQMQLNQLNLYYDSRDARVDYVAKRILDEEALELCFEGTRFYDLLRYTRQEGDMRRDVVLPAYIRETYGPCPSDNKYAGTSWYLPLPRR